MSNFLAGGCSFTFGNELSDDFESRYASKKSWAYKIFENSGADNYHCCAKGGIGNSAIARNVFEQINKIENFGKSFDQLTKETVKAFLVDSKKSNFKI